MLIFMFAGLLVGSFLNMCIDRFPRDESIIGGRSHCDACGHSLRAIDLIPILSYLFVRGHCHFCGVRIPIRNLGVEIGTVALFGLIWLRYPGSWETVLVAFYSSLLIVFLMIDLERGMILNRVSYPAIAVALLFALLVPERTVLEMLAGGMIAFGVLLAIALIFPSGMGMGDVKLAAFVGLAVGYPYVWLALFLAFVFGGLIAGALVLVKVMGRKDPIAFGPFLAAGAVVTMLFGEPILQWWAAGGLL
ncbi:MAG: A24 family peptidase [Anaerolineae bacterium]|nr:MAG: A24 family peptidase [Anaerolineae bacterium]